MQSLKSILTLKQPGHVFQKLIVIMNVKFLDETGPM